MEDAPSPPTTPPPFSSRPCPFCAEEISTAAVRCPHCRSRLFLAESRTWYRDHPSRRLAGVAAGLARVMALPLTPVRAAFIVLSFFHFIGVFAYVALWLVMPFAPGEVAPFARGLVWGRQVLRRLFGENDRPSPPGSTQTGPVP